MSTNMEQELAQPRFRQGLKVQLLALPWLPLLFAWAASALPSHCEARMIIPARPGAPLCRLPPFPPPGQPVLSTDGPPQVLATISAFPFLIPQW